MVTKTKYYYNIIKYLCDINLSIFSKDDVDWKSWFKK